MEAKKIGTKTIGISLLAVFATEAGIQAVVSTHLFRPMMVLGTARLMEIVLFIIIVRHFDRGLSAVGLERSRISYGVKRGMIWSAGFGMVAGLVFAILLATGNNLLTHISAPMPVSFTDMIFLFCVGGIVSPVAEEIFFRGFLYGYFRRWGILIAVILSSMLFVLVHSNTAQIPLPQIVGGVVFAIAYELEGNLVVPIAIHILGNMAIYALSLMF